MQYTTSTTDLAVNGNGFFVVSDAGGTPFLTRAGSFVPDGEGNLINAGGFPVDGVSARGWRSRCRGQMRSTAWSRSTSPRTRWRATPSTEGIFGANLPSNANIVPAGSLPSDNVPGSVFEAKSSLVAYDNLGNEIVLDVYFTKDSRR